MSPDEFNDAVEAVIEDVAKVINGLPCGVVEMALTEMLFNACDTPGEINDLVVLLNTMVDAAHEEMQQGGDWVH